MDLDKIKTLVLDVDGVINGSLININTPFPSNPVIEFIKDFVKSGGLLILCTSKGIYSIREMVERFDLGGVHIADAGAIIFDAKTSIYDVNGLSEDDAQEVINVLETTGNYFEVYTTEDWYILDKFNNKYIKAHADLLRREPLRISSFMHFDKLSSISKFLYFTEDDTKSIENLNLLDNLSHLSTKWTVSPVLHPANLMVITKNGISKQSALLKVAQRYSIDLGKALGVGDHDSDWKFMSICGYKGIMGNSTEELINLASIEDQTTVAYGKGVNEDGLLDIVKNLGII